jgi:hypothetical protein
MCLGTELPFSGGNVSLARLPALAVSGEVGQWGWLSGGS